MNKSAVYILNFEDLYNIIYEIKNFFNFELFNSEDMKSIMENQNKRSAKSFIIVTKKKINEDSINNKQIITIDSFPLNFFGLIEKINSSLLMQQYDFQSNINIAGYKLDINSRVISFNNNKLKLTERETQINLFLKNQNKSINIDILQKEVWGYSQELETHTVETHVYRLRKKLKKSFDDQNFIKSDKKGYFI